MIAQRTIARLRFRWQYVLWLAVPILLWWSFSQIPLREVLATVKQLSVIQIVVLLLVNIVTLLTFSGRWWSIVRAQGYSVGYLKMAIYRLAASGVSYFTPGPQFGGEPLQVLALKRRQGVDTSSAIASVTVDKLVELLVNFAFLMLGVSLIFRNNVFPSLGMQGILVPIGLMAVPTGSLAMLWRGRKPLSPILERLPEALTKREFVRRGYSTLFESEIKAIAFCQEKPQGLFYAVLFSVVSWVAILFEYWLAMHFLGLSLSVTELLMVLGAARIALLLPSPGGLGTLEASQVIILVALGYDPAVGLALSLIIRVRDLLFMGFGLWLSGFIAKPTGHSA